MGIYMECDGSRMGKSAWLEANGAKPIAEPMFVSELPIPKAQGKVYICVVNNFDNFEAALVVWSSREYQETQNPADPRDRKWFEATNELVSKGISNRDRNKWERVKINGYL